MRYFLLSLLWFAIQPVFVSGQGRFYFSPGCQKAYQAAMSLKLDLAASLLDIEKKKNPENIIPLYLENYLDFFELFLNENPVTYEKLKGNKKKRLSTITSCPEASPLKGFMESVIYLQWAAIDTKLGNKMSAGWGFRDALKSIKENQRIYPDFKPNLMILGPVQMAAGTIPKGYRWLSSLIGISGNLETGKKQMDAFLLADDSWSKLFKDEGIFYHCYLQFHLLNEQEEALALIRLKQLDVVNNHLFTFMAANLYLNNKQSEQAKKIVLNRNKSEEYMNTTIWDFELAHAALYHLDKSTPYYFNRFLNSFKGEFYVKDSWMKLAYYYLIKGNRTQYQRCIKMVLTTGKQNAEADKKAYKEAASGKIPNLYLLKARLYSDGGYHQEALQTLEGKSSSDFVDAVERLEFIYRLARIYDDLGEDDKAIETYLTAIATGKTSTEYYAARAALQIGLIYEKRRNKNSAIKYFQECIDMTNHDYELSLEQKAKAGINRCR